MDWRIIPISQSDSFSPLPAECQPAFLPPSPTLEFLSLALSRWPRARATLHAQASKHLSLRALPKQLRRKESASPTPCRCFRAAAADSEQWDEWGGGAITTEPDRAGGYYDNRRRLTCACLARPAGCCCSKAAERNDRGGLKKKKALCLFIFLLLSFRLEPKNCNRLGGRGLRHWRGPFNKYYERIVEFLWFSNLLVIRMFSCV